MTDIDDLLAELDEMCAEGRIEYSDYSRLHDITVTLRPAQLPVTEAEAELLAWCTGERSWTNEMMNAEPGFENRPQTLALIEARDADAIRAARERVEGLRTLRSVQVPVTEEPRLNPRVVLAALDQALAPSGLHRGAHLSTLRLQVKRLRDHVAGYVSPEPLPSPGTTEEEDGQ